MSVRFFKTHTYTPSMTCWKYTYDNAHMASCIAISPYSFWFWSPIYYTHTQNISSLLTCSFLWAISFKVDIILLSLMEERHIADTAIALYSLPMKIVEVGMMYGTIFLNSLLPVLTESIKKKTQKNTFPHKTRTEAFIYSLKYSITHTLLLCTFYYSSYFNGGICDRKYFWIYSSQRYANCWFYIFLLFSLISSYIYHDCSIWASKNDTYKYYSCPYQSHRKHYFYSVFFIYRFSMGNSHYSMNAFLYNSLYSTKRYKNFVGI